MARTRSKCIAEGPAGDMYDLMQRVRLSPVGTGAIRHEIESCQFDPKPGARGFTKMIVACGKGCWRKALEIFDVMKGQIVASWGVQPNAYTYSAVISVCAAARKVDEVYRVFHLMKIESREDPECRPDAVTYNTVIGACEQAGRYQDVIHLHAEMARHELEPDRAAQVCLLEAQIRGKNWRAAQDVLDSMHDKGVAANPKCYADMIGGYATQADQHRALELFLTMQMVEIDPNLATCRALMRVFAQCGNGEMAMDLIEEMEDCGFAGDRETYNNLLIALAAGGEYHNIFCTLDTMQTENIRVFEKTAKSIVDGCHHNSDGNLCLRLRAKLRSMGARVGPSDGWASSCQIPNELGSDDSCLSSISRGSCSSGSPFSRGNSPLGRTARVHSYEWGAGGGRSEGMSYPNTYSCYYPPVNSYVINRRN
ncbi:hypothetical protein BSKO_09422 [Bryopsis sp. KO-2023]|nr:hypothetical protein BSKO_09422 [Bryopsis sp. KO-2023]